MTKDCVENSELKPNEPLGKKPAFKRLKLVVYPRVQWSILLAVSAAALIGAASAAWLIRFFDSLESYDTIPFLRVMIALALVCVVSAIIVLGLYFTNRVFGPIFRLHSEIKSFRAGRPCRTIKLRDGDHFNELIDDWNKLIEQEKR